MKWIVGALIATTISIPASAEHVSRFDAHTVYKSAQCEIGQFAYSIRKQKIAQNRLFAHVTWSGETTIEKKADAGIGFKPLFPLPSWLVAGPSGEVGGSYKTTASGTGETDFNIHPANRQACSKRNKIPVHIYECLRENVDLITSDANPGYASCTTTTIAYGKASASGKVALWFFQFGPSAEFNATRTFTLTVSAPPKPKDKGK